MTRPWDEDEIAWARECAAAGDTPEEIADMAGAPLAEVQSALGGLRRMTANERAVASLLATGMTCAEVTQLRGPGVEPAHKTFSRLKKAGYAVKDNRPSRLSAAEIDALVERLGLESKRALAQLVGVPFNTATKWRERGLSTAYLAELAHA